MFIYYHDECSTCKNTRLTWVKCESIRAGKDFVERPIRALDTWQEEAKLIGGHLPILYDTERNQYLEVQLGEGEREKIKQFMA